MPPRPLRVLRCNALYRAAQLRRGDVRDGPRQSVGHADDHTAMPREHRASVGSVARTGRPLPSGLARKATAVAALSVAATVRAGARLPDRTDRRRGVACDAGMVARTLQLNGEADLVAAMFAHHFPALFSALFACSNRDERCRAARSITPTLSLTQCACALFASVRAVMSRLRVLEYPPPALLQYP